MLSAAGVDPSLFSNINWAEDPTHMLLSKTWFYFLELNIRGWLKYFDIFLLNMISASMEISQVLC